MREAGLWVVDPSGYADPPGGLLSYEADLPHELTSKEGFTPLARNMRLEDGAVQAHFRLINHQLLQLRTALALAHVLNRTLILPRFLCGVETVTNFAHKGIRCVGSNGCSMALPYWCPADHVLRMHYLRGVMPQLPQLPVRYREFSLLAHTLTRLRRRAATPEPPEPPTHAAADTLLVHVRDSPVRRCNDCVPLTPEGYTASMPLEPTPAALAARAVHRVEMSAKPIDERGLLDALRPHAALRHVHFDSLRPDGLRLELAPTTRPAFDETIRYLGGGFCCVEPSRRGDPGHFWYDLLWDVPHRDRWGRVFTKDKPYSPIAGP